MTELIRATAADREFYRNVFNMYQNELSQYFDEYRQLDERGYFDRETVDTYFEGSESIVPYIVLHNGKRVGIVVITSPPYTRAGCDWCIQEMFLICSCRGSGVAAAVCEKLFSLHPGRYCLAALSQNKRAVRFWQSLTQRVSTGVLVSSDERDTFFEFTPGK